jgi:hypothetical protein
MKHSTDILLIAVLVMSILLSACAAVQLPINDMQVAAVQAGTVAYGIQRALNGAPGAFVYQDVQEPGRIIFAWASPGVKGVGFFGVDVTKATTIDVYNILKQGGQMVNLKTASDVTKFFEQTGYKVVPGSSVPVTIKAALGLYMNTMRGTLSVPILIPAGLLAPDLEQLISPETQS